LIVKDAAVSRQANLSISLHDSLLSPQIQKAQAVYGMRLYRISSSRLTDG
jgi:hypothetical protein